MLDRWLMLGCMILELLLCIRLPYLCVCGKEYELYGWKRGIYFGVIFVMAVAVFCLLKPFYFTPISIVVEMTVVLVSVCFLTKEHRIFLSVLGLGILFGIRCLEYGVAYFLLFYSRNRSGSGQIFYGNSSLYPIFLIISLLVFCLLECVDVREKLHDTKENKEIILIVTGAFGVLLALALRGLEGQKLGMEISNGLWVLGGGSLIVIAAALFCIRAREQESLNEITVRNMYLEENFRVLEKKQKEMARMSHDFKNHITVLEHYLQEKETEKALEYVHLLKKPMMSSENLAHCGDKIADLVLNEKINQARQQGILVEMDVEETGKLPFTSFDTCVIFANLLDNAIEACRKMETSRRFLKVSLGRRGPLFLFLVENNIGERPMKKEGKYLSQKRGEKLHGIGLESVEHSLKNYQGQLRTEDREGSFRAEVTVFL